MTMWGKTPAELSEIAEESRLNRGVKLDRALEIIRVARLEYFAERERRREMLKARVLFFALAFAVGVLVGMQF